MISNHGTNTISQKLVSVIVPTKNEAGTIHTIVQSLPPFASHIELLFVDGHSTDGTRHAIDMEIAKHKHTRKSSWLRIVTYQQKGTGKWDAVMLGLSKARGEYVMIYDADMSVPIGDLSIFYTMLCANPDSLIIGSRFVFPQESGAMRLLNHTGNIVFSRLFSLMLHTKITDTLCGTKVLGKAQYLAIMRATHAFRVHDPYGDFTLLLGAAKLYMPIIEVPVSYKARVYGKSKISRFRDGFKLLIVVAYAMRDFWRR
jgi:glycosyltransferase involved in cell wall biosynthesis